ncbi:MAG: SDR family oxidoreductase [Spirochaetaceae bacterium]|nr:SDR family oxidoreductase [Spirochaetaceae bacterium]MBP3664827.1 SDR family oxidoreductase [Tyzzerella sp.]MBQ8385722.1 SDR family oxidoreductase [Spirochaetaceae bacterium]
MGLARFIPKKIKAVLKKILVININTQSLYQLPQKVSLKQFEGKTVIVTGGAGGIGRAICLRMACEGAKVYVCGRTKVTVDSVVEEIHSLGGAAVPLILDVTRFEDIQEKLQIVLGREKLNFLVNCAGGGSRGAAKPFIKQDYSVINDIIHTNLMGTVNMCRGCVSYIPRGGGIINISSIIGLGGKENYSEYAAAKAGINGFSKSLALELGKLGIRVNVVSPGKILRGIMSERDIEAGIRCNYLGIPGKPEDIAGAVCYLLSDEAKFITGINLCVDGGRTLGLHGD